MKTKHINDISIGALCDTAGVGRASFYRNFDSKEDVIAKELKKRLDEWWLSAIVKPDFNFVRALFEHYYENSEICILLYRQGLSHLSLQSVLSACGPKDEQENFDAYTSLHSVVICSPTCHKYKRSPFLHLSTAFSINPNHDAQEFLHTYLRQFAPFHRGNEG